ncbi:hypothetical protein PGRAN_12981 [Listeria grandensis FSL F6-0971]|uniref:Uncharacterized protein n=1 Tax=Listeria grandensis FSL F6-0971 TaxID=1265819 RepID=W7B9D0_9LIST|nr:hypothetical protein [Listeria grandensis]EUJ22542.1 hypothetical protein PGRAN_12981 [Listeria grandensis FSL F6-0971]
MSATLVVAMGMASISPTIAASAEETEMVGETNKEQVLTEGQVLKFDQYVVLNVKTGAFSIKDDAKRELSSTEFNLLHAKINDANLLTEEMISTENVDVTIDSQGVTITEKSANGPQLLKRAKYIEGKNAVKGYWWGLRVWVKKATVHKVGNGAAIGGIWIPGPLIGKVVSTLGVVLSACPGGIVFNSTPSPVPASLVWGSEYQ